MFQWRYFRLLKTQKKTKNKTKKQRDAQHCAIDKGFQMPNRRPLQFNQLLGVKLVFSTNITNAVNYYKTDSSGNSWAVFQSMAMSISEYDWW